MIASAQTNFLYLADTLPKKYPSFFQHFEKVLTECKVTYELLAETKDVWAVDYMPVQVRKNKFVQFVYDPDYLQSKKYINTISETAFICKKIGIKPIKTDIKLDGGNVVKSSHKVIMTEKVFKENPSYQKVALIEKLEEFFETDQLFFIPKQPYDFTGHADGMLRFIDDDTLLVNNYKNEKEWFQKAFERAIRKTGMNVILIPYNPYNNKTDEDAKGTYINYLQMENTVIVPLFGIKEDDEAVRTVEEVLKGNRILTINANEIAKDGGVLNCISWNILA